MNYIVFDLEWNQCPGGKEKENKKLPFEIIQIGAVKLDDSGKNADSFRKRSGPGSTTASTAIPRKSCIWI